MAREATRVRRRERKNIVSGVALNLSVMRTEIDVLVLDNCLLDKATQPPLVGDSDWKREFELD